MNSMFTYFHSEDGAESGLLGPGPFSTWRGSLHFLPICVKTGGVSLSEGDIFPGGFLLALTCSPPASLDLLTAPLTHAINPFQYSRAHQEL